MMQFQQESLDLSDVEPYDLQITVNGENIKETQVILGTESDLQNMTSVCQAIQDFKRSKVIVLYSESGRTIVINYDGKTDQKVQKKYSDLKKAAKSLIEITNQMKISSINLKVMADECTTDLFINVFYVQNHKYHRKMKSNNILGKSDFDKKEDDRFIDKTFCQVKRINLQSEFKHEGLDGLMQFSKSQIFAKNLGSLRANQGSTTNMKKVCEQVGDELGDQVKVTVISGQSLLDNRLNLIHAVGRANPNEPCMVDMVFMNNPDSDEVISLVGKGIVFDAGGLNIKQGLIEQMWVDKCGACNVISIFRYAVKMGLKINLTCTVGWAENSISGNSYRPSDIIQSYKGISVEIGNTDAEGRLVLADCMSYAQFNHKTTTLIELSTLTGAIIVALGFSAAGCYSNNEDLQDQLVKSSHQKGECLVPIPVFDENTINDQTPVADICNMPSSRFGGAGNAAAFLNTFIEEGVNYAHLDIAGVSLDMSSKQATGIIAQTVLNYLVTK